MSYIDRGVGVEPHDQFRLQRLWAPYRSAYLTNPDDKKADSSSQKAGNSDPFIEIPKKSDEDGLIVARGEYVFCCLNLYPYNAGHMLVIPYRQVADYTELSDAETWELAQFTKHAMQVLRAVSGPDAINVGMNLGRPSGGSIPMHLHQHVVPRWTGDTSFMTVIAGAKVMPQLLRETRALFAAEWERMRDNNDRDNDDEQDEEQA